MKAIIKTLQKKGLDVQKYEGIPGTNLEEISLLLGLKQAVSLKKAKEGDSLILMMGIISSLDEFQLELAKKESASLFDQPKKIKNNTTLKQFTESNLLFPNLGAKSFLMFALGLSRKKMNGLLDGSISMTQPIIMQVFILNLIKESFIAKNIEKEVFDKLSYIEEFRYSRYIRIRKLSPFFIKGTCKKQPLWIRFFDHSDTSLFPNYGKILTVYNLIKSLDGKTDKTIQKDFQSICGKGEKLNIFRFGEIKQLLETGISMADAKRKIHPELEATSFYNLYKRWSKNWVKTDYWLK